MSSEATVVTSTPPKHAAKAVNRHDYTAALRTGDLAEEIHSAEPETFAADANGSTNSTNAVLPPVNNAIFLDPSADYIWYERGNINRMPVNVGQYLDPNSVSPSSSAVGTSDIRQTSIDVGKYISADTEPHELVITIDGNAANTRSNVGHYLDPEAESSAASSVDPSDQRNVGSFLDPDI